MGRRKVKRLYPPLEREIVLDYLMMPAWFNMKACRKKRGKRR